MTEKCLSLHKLRSVSKLQIFVLSHLMKEHLWRQGLGTCILSALIYRYRYLSLVFFKFENSWIIYIISKCFCVPPTSNSSCLFFLQVWFLKFLSLYCSPVLPPNVSITCLSQDFIFKSSVRIHVCLINLAIPFSTVVF